MADLSDSDPSVPPRPLPETTKSDEGKQVIGSDDLVPTERKRLGDYLAYQTQQVFKNEYPISDGSTIFKQKTPTGNPAPISDIDSNAVNTYMDDVSQTDKGQMARSVFESSSESGLLDTDTKFVIKKGKSDSTDKTGNQYFREIDDKGGDAEIPQRIEKVMLANNRFAQSNPAFTSGQAEGVQNSIGSLIVQPKLGQHVPQKFPRKADGEGGDFVSIPIDKLKNFGLTTLLNASGEINVPKDLSDPFLAMGASQTATIPGLARIGQRVPVGRFDQVKILNDLEPTYNKELRNQQLQGPDILSHGNTNNPLVPFAGLLSASSIASAQLLALTVAGMLKTLYLTLNAVEQEKKILGTNAISTTTTPSQARKLRLGNYDGKVDDNANYRPYRDYSVINLVKTKYPYFKCVEKGISVFFGTENTSQLAIVNNNNIQLSSGWYNTVFRNLLRTTSDLLTSVISTDNAGIRRQSYDVDPNLGGTGAVAVDVGTSAVSYVQQINNSPILKFMNILALIGEAAFQNIANQTPTIDQINDVGEDPDGAMFPKLGVLHTKNRLSDAFGNKLAWGSNTVKSMYLLPNQIKTAANRLDGDDGRFSGFTAEKGFKTSDTGRFSSEQVEAMEDYLEADYMPFYFHDLRTNEIISFHAFLDDVSDNYTVDYTENEGYGRVGKVLTYKNTNRQINLSFAVVATNLDDFDDMWYKIDKLITLLYPQYTEGRSLQFGQDSFIQPFSQVLAASPLIRIRLGDIFKSNYNKFNLARVFGLASPEFYIQSQAQARSQQQQQDLESARIQIRNRMNSGDWRNGDIANVDGQVGSLIRVVEEGASPPLPVDGASPPLTDLNLTGPALVSVVETNVSQTSTDFFSGRAFTSNYIKIRIQNPLDASEQGDFLVSTIQLQVYEPEVERQAQQQAGVNPTDLEASDASQDRQTLDNFFASSGDQPNPIFKSFESVRGRGLAGFIRNFSLNIDQKFPWETVGLNNRAPKLLKITLQFDPIHDLQPGLDHNGFNNAPVYNVGGLSKSATRKSQADLAAKDTAYRQNTQIKTGANRRNS